MGDHPLRPPTRLRLGEPLPHQQADGPQAPPEALPPFLTGPLTPVSLWGISSRFQLLSPSSGQVTYVLLTRLPLSPSRLLRKAPVRLACIRHAASVHPEPGSNSSSLPLSHLAMGRVLVCPRLVSCGVPHVFLSRLQLLRCPSESNPPTVFSRRQDGCQLPCSSLRSLSPPSASFGCEVSTRSPPRVCFQYNMPLTFPQDGLC